MEFMDGHELREAVAPHLLLKVKLLCKCDIPWINR
jgi:hypothetical protein